MDLQVEVMKHRLQELVARQPRPALQLLLKHHHLPGLGSWHLRFPRNPPGRGRRDKTPLRVDIQPLLRDQILGELVSRSPP